MLERRAGEARGIAGEANDRGLGDDGEARIRRGGVEDVDAAATLWVRARAAATRRGAIPPSAHDAEEVGESLRERLLGEAELWLAEVARGTLVGMLVLEGEWLDQLYVDDPSTGRGVGTRLVALAKRERPEGLRLWTFESNARAHRFYERHGFVLVKRTDGRGNEERAPDRLYAWCPAGEAGSHPAK